MLQKTLNLVILAHVDAGRTLTEPLLEAAGFIGEIGSVDDGFDRPGTSRSAGSDR